jgi:hypothetical protein
MNVDDDGLEHEDLESAAARGEYVYTPNYVSDPEPVENGLAMYVDCKGAIEPGMRDRFIQILAEELRDLGDDVFVGPA